MKIDENLIDSNLDIETRPYPNYHAARVKDPDLFDHIVVLATLGNGIMIYGGPLKSNPKGPTEQQAYRFPKSKFTVAEAKKWLKDHDIKWILFEPATEGDSADMKDIERRFVAVPGEFRIVSDDGKPKRLVGYAAPFNSLSEPLYDFVERILPGAFAETIKNDDIRALFNHDTDKILGRNTAGTLRLSEDQKGLRYEIDLPDTTVGRDLPVSVERGDITGTSFGFRTLSDKWSTENGKNIRTLQKVKLFDISPCTFPAYPDTSVALRSMEQWREENKKDSKPAESGIEIERKKLDLLEVES